MKKHSGFTLLELMICIAIVGILAAVFLPLVIRTAGPSPSNSSSQGISYSLSAGAIERRCENGVMYLVTPKAITPMLNNDGTPSQC